MIKQDASAFVEIAAHDRAVHQQKLEMGRLGDLARVGDRLAREVACRHDRNDVRLGVDRKANFLGDIAKTDSAVDAFALEVPAREQEVLALCRQVYLGIGGIAAAQPEGAGLWVIWPVPVVCARMGVRTMPLKKMGLSGL